MSNVQAQIVASCLSCKADIVDAANRLRSEVPEVFGVNFQLTLCNILASAGSNIEQTVHLDSHYCPGLERSGSVLHAVTCFFYGAGFELLLAMVFSVVVSADGCTLSVAHGNFEEL